MGRKKPLKILVLGAGPSGLSAAWNLVQDGHEVTVIEKETVCGGQSITFDKGGYRYDLGPHNIHSQRKSVTNFLKDNLSEEFVKHKFFSQIYFRGKRINYPIMGIDVLRSINVFTAILCGLSFFAARFGSLFIPKFKDKGNYRTWIVNRFGHMLYNIYFAPYSEKVWKIPPSKISDIVAKKRIAISGIMELIHSVIFKKQRFHPENPHMVDNFYPKHGIGSVSDFFVKGILEGGGKIITGSTVKKIILDNNVVRQVHYSDNDQVKCIDCKDNGQDSQWKILSTIPVNEMALMLEGNVPEDVKTAAKGLDFTSEVFLYLNVSKPNVFNVPLLYFSEPEFIFNRIYDIGAFSRDMVPSGKNAVCFEISCNYDDEIWKMDDHPLFERCIESLEKYELLNRRDVEGFHTRRLVHAYPRFRIGYEKKLKTIFSFLGEVTNLMSFGREGLFEYVNVDDAIWMGFEIAKHVGYQDRMKLSVKELLPTYISF